MTTTQKIIKYTAGAFALFLAISILAGILQFIVVVVGGMAGWNKNLTSYNQNFEYDKITNLDIDMAFGELIIKPGKILNVEAKNVPSDFSCKTENNTLKICSDGKNFSFSGGSWNSKIILTVPADFQFENVDIDFSCGEVNFTDLTANNSFRLDSGCGEITLKNVQLNDADISLGVGEIDVNGVLSGKSSLDNGIGEIEVNIYANPDNYIISKDHGIGESKVKDETAGRYENITSPKGSISTDIGIGETTITFK